MTLNAKGIITHINLTAEELLGAPEEHSLRSNLSRFFVKDWQDAYLAALGAAVEIGKIQSVELLLQRQNDPSFWVRADIRADEDESYAAERWFVTLTDITEGKNAAAALPRVRARDRSKGRTKPQASRRHLRFNRRR